VDAVKLGDDTTSSNDYNSWEMEPISLESSFACFGASLMALAACKIWYDFEIKPYATPATVVTRCNTVTGSMVEFSGSRCSKRRATSRLAG
jgi:hypothetical protein